LQLNQELQILESGNADDKIIDAKQLECLQAFQNANLQTRELYSIYPQQLDSEFDFTQWQKD
jgi:hypothetical protein